MGDHYFVHVYDFPLLLFLSSSFPYMYLPPPSPPPPPLSPSLPLSLSLPPSLSPPYSQEAAKSLLLPILLNYVTAFVEILSSPLPSNSDNLLRKEVIMTLCQLLRSFPRPLTPHMMSIVTPVWNILVSNTSVYPISCADLYRYNRAFSTTVIPLIFLTQFNASYVSTVVNSADSAGDEVYDSDGEVIGQESTIFAVFEFISVLGEGKRFQNLLIQILPELMYYLIAHMQITEAQVSSVLYYNYR